MLRLVEKLIIIALASLLFESKALAGEENVSNSDRCPKIETSNDAELEARTRYLFSIKNITEATCYLRKGMEKDIPSVINYYGIMVLKGTNFPQDTELAIMAFKRASDLGYEAALFNLASILFYERKFAESKQEFEKYLKNDNLVAPMYLALISNLEGDYRKADKYFEQSFSNGLIVSYLLKLQWFLEKVAKDGSREDYIIALELLNRIKTSLKDEDAVYVTMRVINNFSSTILSNPEETNLPSDSEKEVDNINLLVQKASELELKINKKWPEFAKQG